MLFEDFVTLYNGELHSKLEQEIKIDFVVTIQGFCGKITPSKLLDSNQTSVLKAILIYFNGTFLYSNDLRNLNIYLAPKSSNVNQFRMKPFDIGGDRIKSHVFETVTVDIRVSKSTAQYTIA